MFLWLQGFVANQDRVRNLADPSILPDLCNSHKRQLLVMLRNHQSLRDIHGRCTRAKEELSHNLHTRLRYIWHFLVNSLFSDLKNIIFLFMFFSRRSFCFNYLSFILSHRVVK